MKQLTAEIYWDNEYLYSFQFGKYIKAYGITLPHFIGILHNNNIMPESIRKVETDNYIYYLYRDAAVFKNKKINIWNIMTKLDYAMLSKIDWLPKEVQLFFGQRKTAN